jgi:hypothetical protein
MAIFSREQLRSPVEYYTDSAHADNKGVDNIYFRIKDDDFVYAKKIPSESFLKQMMSNSPGKNPPSYDYMVRLSPDLKTVYDPRVKYCIPDNRPDFVARVCKNGEKPLFTKVNESIFSKYLLFLGNQSDSQYRECNRLVFGL